MNNMDEIWKCIPGFNECYQVSNMCRARSKKSGKWKILSTPLACGYPHICIVHNKKPVSLSMHRAVYMAFKGSIPDEYQVDHINFDRTDCRPENLQLLTREENIKRSVIRRRLNSGFTSNYEGVSYNKKNGRYYSKIKRDGHIFNIAYKTEIEALEAIIMSKIGIFPHSTDPEAVLSKKINNDIRSAKIKDIVIRREISLIKKAEREAKKNERMNKKAEREAERMNKKTEREAERMNKKAEREAKKEYIIKIKSRDYKNAVRAKKHSEMFIKKKIKKI